MICVKFTVFLRLASRLACRLATLRKSIRKFWFCKLGSTCVDLQVRLARALKKRKLAAMFFVIFASNLSMIIIKNDIILW